MRIFRWIAPTNGDVPLVVAMHLTLFNDFYVPKWDDASEVPLPLAEGTYEIFGDTLLGIPSVVLLQLELLRMVAKSCTG